MRHLSNIKLKSINILLHVNRALRIFSKVVKYCLFPCKRQFLVLTLGYCRETFLRVGSTIHWFCPLVTGKLGKKGFSGLVSFLSAVIPGR